MSADKQNKYVDIITTHLHNDCFSVNADQLIHRLRICGLAF